MRSVVVVVTNILAHQPLQMTFIQRDHMVEQISAAVADPMFRNAILPGTSEARPFGFDAEALHDSGHLFVKVRGPVENQVVRCGVIGECFSKLMCDLGTIWMSGNVPVQNAPPVMGDDKEAVENAKAYRRYCEEVHRGDGFPMIAEKRRPSYCRLRTPRCLPHPA